MLDDLFIYCFFFFNDTCTTEIYTYCHPLSLHDSLPICAASARASSAKSGVMRQWSVDRASRVSVMSRLLQKARAATGWCDDVMTTISLPDTAAMVIG